MIAKFDGRCYACNELIKAGTECDYSPQLRKVRHFNCVTEPEHAHEEQPEELAERLGYRRFSWADYKARLTSASDTGDMRIEKTPEHLKLEQEHSELLRVDYVNGTELHEGTSYCSCELARRIRELDAEWDQRRQIRYSAKPKLIKANPVKCSTKERLGDCADCSKTQAGRLGGFRRIGEYRCYYCGFWFCDDHAHEHFDDHDNGQQKQIKALEERLRLAEADRDRAIQLAKTFKGKIAVMPLSDESYSGYEVAKAELETLEEAIALAKLKPTAEEK